MPISNQYWKIFAACTILSYMYVKCSWNTSFLNSVLLGNRKHRKSRDHSLRIWCSCMDYFPISSIFSIIKSSTHHHIRNSLDISSSYLQYNLKYKYTMIITHGIFLGFWFLVRNEEKNEIPREKWGKFEETSNITFSPISLILGVFRDNFWPFFGN